MQMMKMKIHRHFSIFIRTMDSEMFFFYFEKKTTRKQEGFYSSSCKTSFDRSETNGTEPGLLFTRALAS